MAKDDDKQFGDVPELPEEVRLVFEDLCKDLASLHGKWRFYLDLFSDADTVDVLSDVARASFQMVDESLGNDIVMAICRLSDPSQLGSHANLSIGVLAKKFSELPEVKQLWDDFEGLCGPVRQYRNKRIGHNDLNTVLQPHDNLLPNIPRATIDSILSAAAKLLNYVYHHYTNSGLIFEPLCIGGGKDLVLWLKRAQDHDRASGFPLSRE